MTIPSTSAGTRDETVIRDAACVIVIDETRSEPTLLMGRRRSDQIFLPDKWVFPGGRVDEDDRSLAETYPITYSPPDLAPHLRSFALAAVRELSEETGLIIGTREFFAGAQGSGWLSFAGTGHAPEPSQLLPFARAITPPGRVRRYDTWFFLARSRAVSETRKAADGELLDLNWFTLGEARKLDLPNITKLVLEDVAARLHLVDEAALESLPFYYSDDCGFQRTLISCRETSSAP